MTGPVDAAQSSGTKGRRLRLLFVIDSFNSGGAQRQMILLAVALVRRGHHVEFFRYAPGDLLAPPLEREGIRVTTSLKPSRYSLAPVRALRRLIAAGTWDCVLSYLEMPNVYAVLAARATGSVPLVVSERSCDPPVLRAKTQLLRQIYRLADAVVVNSRHQGENFLRRYPWMNGRLRTILNGVDLEAFRRERRPLAREPLRLLAIGSISPFKNGLCLVEALRILCGTAGLRPLVSWIGQHVDAIPERREYGLRMKQAIASYGLEAQWNWMYQLSDVGDMLASHHALVHPSVGEGLPNVVCEALSSGTPVLISNVLDHPYLVEDGRTGFLFDPLDPKSLAHVIMKFHRMDDAERERMSKNAAAFAAANFSVDRLADDYESLFMELSGRRTA